MRHPTGEFHWVSAKAVPLRDGDGSIREWVGVLMDVEERRQAEDALRTSEERLRLAIETTALGIWDVDLIWIAINGQPRRDKSSELQPMLRSLVTPS